MSIYLDPQPTLSTFQVGGNRSTRVPGQNPRLNIKYGRANKGRFRSKPISGFVDILAFDQSEGLNPQNVNKTN